MPTQPRPPITDSPWFWLILFSLAAIGGLLAIAPKYAIRQAGVERKSAAREEVARRRHTGQAPQVAPEVVAEPVEPPPLRVPLWTLAVTIVLLFLVVIIAAWQLRRSLAAPYRDRSL